MYRDYFGFHEKPFTIAPNPRFLYMSERHRDALAHLLFGVGDGGGFVVLTGEVGTGKTTLCRRLLEQLPPQVDVAYILNPKLSAVELVQTICEDLGLSLPKDVGSLKQLGDCLNRFLLKQHANGRKTVLIIDEAQNLSVEVLEQIRLLTNLETNEEKLLQIVLIGQPELRDLLGRDELRQLLQRVTARFHLTQLNEEETASYVQYRLSVAGCQRPVFEKRALKALFRHSRGIPRLINVLADRALLGAYAKGRPCVSARLVHQAAEELGALATRKNGQWRRWAVLAVVLVSLLAWNWLDESPRRAETAAVVVTADTAQSTWRSQPNLTKALSELGQLWHVPEEFSCDRPMGRLRCEEGVLGWQSLLALNVPAVLELDGPNPGYVVLVTLADDKALIMSGERAAMEVGELRAHWTGKTWWMWSAPVDYQGPMSLGSRGAGVAELKRQLLLQQGIPEESLIVPQEAQFDSALRLLVEQFQRRHGLKVDGVVGAQTWIRLKQVTDPGVPRLRRLREP